MIMTQIVLCLQDTNNVSVAIGENMKWLDNIQEINCEIESHMRLEQTKKQKSLKAKESYIRSITYFRLLEIFRLLDLDK